MNPQWASRVWLALLLIATYTTAIVEASRPGWKTQPADIRLPGGMRIISVSEPNETFGAKAAGLMAAASSSYPQPPLGGFASLIAITTSDERTYLEFEWNHAPQNSYVGSALNPPANENFVIGTLDSGSVLDLAASSGAATLGITGPYLTPYVFPIGGVGGAVDADVSQPVGIFAAGLGAIQANGQLDLGQVIGHTNVSTLVMPDLDCGGESITAIVGTPLISFFTTVINNDNPQLVTVGGENIVGPDIQILQQSDPCIPVYPRKISIQFGGLVSVTTASYYGDIMDFITPEWPTFLSMGTPFIPLGGGAFFADMGVLEGTPGPDNILQIKRVLVDTGAQTSIISPDVVSDLSLPMEPDFTVDICGIGGLVEDVNGFYIDYVKISAQGGALEFSQAPFIVLDLQSPEGGSLDGIIGTNFFWNRNIVFEPALVGTGYVHVSDPVPFGYVDFDGDKDVDMEDFAIFTSAWQTEAGDADYNPACDVFIDAFVDGRDLAAFMQAWLRNY